MAIEQFRDEYYFLDSMFPLPVKITTTRGIAVPTVEHGYQAAKFADFVDHRRVAESAADPVDGRAAKALAYEMIEAGEPTLEDWDAQKLHVMIVLLRLKFGKIPVLGDLLIKTGDEQLIEGNDRGDRFWGVDPIGSDNGENHLGRLLMQVRDELAEGGV